MPMNLIIQEKRKELGITQEQVAEYLHVSTPAVCKWEKGITSPDISLLPALARLLKIDLNTLFDFQKSLTKEEISDFCREVSLLAESKGVSAALAAAMEKQREYPHQEELQLCLAIVLDGLRLTHRGSGAEEETLDAAVAAWYEDLCEGEDENIRGSANYFMVNRCIQKKEYQRAQEILDRMPDRDELIRDVADKKLLQVTLDQEQGETAKAAETLEQALFQAVNRVHLLMSRLVDTELAAGELQKAREIAEKNGRLIEVLDLWDYLGHLSPLQVSVKEQNVDESLRLLKSLLREIQSPWDAGQSPLYYRIADSLHSQPSQLVLPALLSAIEEDPDYAFLRDREEYREFVAGYRTL